MDNWIRLAQQGDRDAFERIVVRFRGMALAIAADRLNDGHLAEDAVQEAFTEVYLHLPKLREPRAFAGWLKRIVVRRCSRMLRRKRLPAAPLDRAAGIASDGRTPPEMAEYRELREALRSSVSELPRNQRLAVQMFYFQGYSLNEISDALNIPVPTLKKRLFDARRKLRGSLPVLDPVSVFRHLYEGGGERMLHIVNGDTVAEKLQGIVQGEIVVWREIYTEGPVFAGPETPERRMTRALALEESLGIPREEYIRSCAEQERRLERFRDYEEVVLWFEHDLFDQTMLCRLLHWFAQEPPGRTRLHLLCIGSFPGVPDFRGLGQLSSEQMSTLSGTWHPIGSAELDLGSRVWQAYASPDPQALLDVLREDTAALPFVREAFTFHLSRYPSVQSGLGSVETAVLRRLREAEDGARPWELFRQTGAEFPQFGMGDLQFCRMLGDLSQGQFPLIRIEGPAPLPRFAAPSPAFGENRIALTAEGRRVLDGEADWVRSGGIDRWLGGVRLQGRNPGWRWHEAAGTLIRT